MIRAAAKNFRDLTVLAAKDDYAVLNQILIDQAGSTSLDQRKAFAAKAFEVVMNYDIAISNYFNPQTTVQQTSAQKQVLRYGENPHQQASFHGNLTELFAQLNGKELSYNNIADADAAWECVKTFEGHACVIIKRPGEREPSNGRRARSTSRSQGRPRAARSSSPMPHA